MTKLHLTLSAQLRTLIFLLAALAALPGQAYIGQATDEAFAALLAMPGAAPEEGHWDFPLPEDFEPGNESRLIAYLAKKQKAGADFKAYRHFGSLLHHAIRAGKTKTALWLLEHGADPRQTLQRGNENALTLSQKYKRNNLTRVLMDKYGLKAEPKMPPQRTTVTKPKVMKLKLTSSADYDTARGWLKEALFASNIALGYPSEATSSQKVIEQWEDFVHQLPPGAYAKLLDDDSAMHDLVQLYGRSPRELKKALAGIPVEVITRRAKSAVDGIARMADARYRDEKDAAPEYSIPAESWRVLWRRVKRPIDYSDWPALAGKIQPELWPELFASGYTNRKAESALGCLLAQIGAIDLKTLWPSLEAHFPDLRQSAPQMVLADYRMLTRNTDCGLSRDEASRNKLLFLSSQGIQGQVKGILQGRLDDKLAELLAAMKPQGIPPA